MSSDGFLAGAITGALLISLVEADYHAMRTTRVRWTAFSTRERATKLRSYGRNIMKTIVQTPRDLSNQRSQSRKLQSVLQRAHDLDRSVLSHRCLTEVTDLVRRLDRASGWRSAHVNTINIS